MEKYAYCPDCHGTGIFSGYCEKKGEGIICLRCDGSGKVLKRRLLAAQVPSSIIKPFTGRLKRDGIERVFRRARDGKPGPTITYQEFLAGKMPPWPE